MRNFGNPEKFDKVMQSFKQEDYMCAIEKVVGQCRK